VQIRLNAERVEAQVRLQLQRKQHHLLNKEGQANKALSARLVKDRVSEAKRRQRLKPQPPELQEGSRPGDFLLDEWLQLKEQSLMELLPEPNVGMVVHPVDPDLGPTADLSLPEPSAPSGNFTKVSTSMLSKPRAQIKDKDADEEWWLEEQDYHQVPQHFVEPSWRSIGRSVEKSSSRQAWESRTDPRLLRSKKTLAQQQAHNPKFRGTSPSPSAASFSSNGLLPVVLPPPMLPNLLRSVPINS